jgi:diaminohydroxyphosphoribosylaminopyrimidine deaminase/5-amino-6-(5-phosphoribosylamino)uracil reductase
MADPNSLVSGGGMERLRAAGIKIECGLMETAAQELNIGFVTRMTRGIPWVRSEIAASLDGRTALENGASQWITGNAARRDVQHWRARSCAVLTGIGTVLADDPQLNVREIEAAARTRWGEAHGCGKGEQAAERVSGVLIERNSADVRQPLRVVLDSQLRIPPTARILQSKKVLIYSAVRDQEKITALEKLGVSVCVLPNENEQVNLMEMMRDLAQREINEVLLEAGNTLNGAMLQAGLVDELVLYLAPQLLGDLSRGMVQLGELTRLDQRIDLKWQDVRQVGNDLRMTLRIENV